MITGETRNKIDRIWDSFWTGGITNPLTVIEQFTYLLFIKSLDDKQLNSEKEASILGIKPKVIFDKNNEDLRWSNFKHFDSEKMYKVVSTEVFPFIKKMNGNADSSFARFMEDAIFTIPTPRMLQTVVTNIDELMADLPLKDLGDLYEYMLSKLTTAGKNGQFRTPRHIIDMMVELVKPTPSDIVMDPAAGTTGFLISVADYLKKNFENEIFTSEQLKEHFNNEMFNGNEIDTTMLRIGTMNMLLHDVENPQIHYVDSLSKSNKEREKYTLVLANPPFKGSLDKEAVADDLTRITNTGKTELLFIGLILELLKSGGRAGVIVPDGVLFGASNAHKSLRKEIIDKHKLEGVISMPSGVFKPYTGVSTAILLFTKTGIGGTDKVWFYDMEADGLSLDDKREKVKDNDIEDVIARFHKLEDEDKRERTEKSFLVPVEEIRENGYDLSINRYKEIVYDEVEYEEPLVLIEKIKGLEKDILLGIDEIEKLVK
ncbi:type I restriction-modification system subunit M [Dolosicoccus paucivorans]|uniref:type I restriction-modification system subunit M n=1 Tax=Dolosicoccus paucivorans TaxID=84521 RepID=UPI000886DCE4|nr:class I SAM-dependent DNA methyltransferase [Dolosicoccus paucivorans]SDI57897.1 type I restriction enzyme M protein [Dolosicoccus paucivorans]